MQALAETRIGDVLKGKYRLDRVLGIGGMATVYAATHRNQKEVAIKILHPELSRLESMRTRFLREGYVANSVKHPGAVSVLDDDVAEDGAAYLVMELLEGSSVEELCESEGGLLAAPRVLGLADQLLDVLSAAHARGIVHRDLKPANLFVTRTGELKVLDFGIARLHDAAGPSATQSGAVMGSPAFMAPEQAMGKTRDIDARTDLWAVAATLFSVLSGRQVHEGETVTEVLILRATTPARSLATVAPAVAPSIVAAVDRGLAFDRKDRWESASAMRAALQRAQLEAFGAPVIRPAASSSAMLDTLGIDSGPALSGRPELASQPRLDVIAATQALPPDGSAAQATRSAREAAANRPLLLSLGVGALLVLGGAVAVVALQHGTASAEPPRSAPAASAPATPATTATPSDPPPLAATAPPTPAVPASSATAASSAPVPPRATARAASPRQVTTPSAARAVALTPPPSCDPPFSIDSSGIKHPKPECMR